MQAAALSEPTARAAAPSGSRCSACSAATAGGISGVSSAKMAAAEFVMHFILPGIAGLCRGCSMTQGSTGPEAARRFAASSSRRGRRSIVVAAMRAAAFTDPPQATHLARRGERRRIGLS